jgi:nucleoside-diphosphate-sugar epimerase
MNIIPKTILLTGATGFIGSHMLERLLQDEYRVIALIRGNSDARRIAHLLAHKNLQITNMDSISGIFEFSPPDIVIHMATCYKKNHSPEDIAYMIEWNIHIPTTICQLCADHGVKYFINTGTFFEYDRTVHPITESSPEKVLNLYASTKLAFANILKYYTEQYDIKALTLKLFMPYGPRDNIKLIPVAIRALLNHSPMTLSAPKHRLNFTYASDIIDAYLCGLEALPHLPSYEVVNIAHPETTSLESVVRMIEKIVGEKIDLQINPPDHLPWDSSYDGSKAKEVLGWEAKIPLEEGLRRTTSWYQENRDL